MKANSDDVVSEADQTCGDPLPDGTVDTCDDNPHRRLLLFAQALIAA